MRFVILPAPSSRGSIDPLLSDRQKHRGAHPKDAELFAQKSEPDLRRASEELSWLLSRRYNVASALSLVGNRYSLRTRQRRAVRRSACTDDEREARARRRVAVGDLSGERILLDGFNVVIAIEAALSGGVLLIGRDGVLRDMASVHGSYRRVAETVAALGLIAKTLAEAGCGHAEFWLDRPVSNSGRLAAPIREHVGSQVDTSVELANDPDRELIERRENGIVCSGDSLILDECHRWFDLSAAVVSDAVPTAWVLDFRVSG